MVLQPVVFGQTTTDIANSLRVYKTAVAGPVRSLDPMEAQDSSEWLILRHLVEPLLLRNPRNGTIEPLAAKKYTVSSDGRKVTFVLRKDLYFSSGQKITAEDYLYSFRRLLSPSNRSYFADRLRLIRNAQDFLDGAVMDPNQLGVKAVNARTLVIELERPSIVFLDALTEPATAPIAKHAVEKYKRSWWFPQHWVGSGAFVLKSQTQETIVLQKNPHHRGSHLIALDEVQIRLLENPQQGVDLYLSGQLDQFGYHDFGVPSYRIPKLMGRKDLIFQPDLHTHFLRLNTSVVPLSQLKLRQAIAMALDRTLLLQGIGVQGERMALSLVPDGLPNYDAPHGYLFYAVGAKRIIRELGYCKNTALPSCKSFPLLTISYPEGERKKKIALTIKTILKNNLGIDSMILSSKPMETFLASIAKGDYMIALDDMAAPPEQPMTLLDAFRKGSSASGGFSQPEYEQLLDDGDKALDWSTAASFFRRAESLLLRDGGIVPLFHGTVPVLVSPKVKGYEPNIWDLHSLVNISISLQ